MEVESTLVCISLLCVGLSFLQWDTSNTIFKYFYCLCSFSNHHCSQNALQHTLGLQCTPETKCTLSCLVVHTHDLIKKAMLCSLVYKLYSHKKCMWHRILTCRPLQTSFPFVIRSTVQFTLRLKFCSSMLSCAI